MFADTDNRSGLLTLPNSATPSSCFRRVSDSESVATGYQLARMRHPLSLSWPKIKVRKEREKKRERMIMETDGGRKVVAIVTHEPRMIERDSVTPAYENVAV